jgi:hypothetical protein
MVNPKLTRANFKTGRLVKLFSQREPDGLGNCKFCAPPSPPVARISSWAAEQ